MIELLNDIHKIHQLKDLINPKRFFVGIMRVDIEDPYFLSEMQQKICNSVILFFKEYTTISPDEQSIVLDEKNNALFPIPITPQKQLKNDGLDDYRIYCEESIYVDIRLLLLLKFLKKNPQIQYIYYPSRMDGIVNIYYGKRTHMLKRMAHLAKILKFGWKYIITPEEYDKEIEMDLAKFDTPYESSQPYSFYNTHKITIIEDKKKKEISLELNPTRSTRSGDAEDVTHYGVRAKKKIRNIPELKNAELDPSGFMLNQHINSDDHIKNIQYCICDIPSETCSTTQKFTKITEQDLAELNSKYKKPLQLLNKEIGKSDAIAIEKGRYAYDKDIMDSAKEKYDALYNMFNTICDQILTAK